MDNFVADAIFIDASPERVFAALLDPEEALVWMDGVEARIAPGEGGEFRVERSDGSTVSGRIRELVAGERIEVADYFWEKDGRRRGPMAIRFTLEPVDDGVWIVVRQDGLDTGSGWEAFAQDTRRELIASTVTLKRHIEGI